MQLVDGRPFQNTEYIDSYQESNRGNKGDRLTGVLSLAGEDIVGRLLIA